MSRKLAKSTVERFRKRLEEERDHLEEQIAEYEREIEEARMTEASSDRSPDPGNAEASSVKLEYAKELSIERTPSTSWAVRHMLRIGAGPHLRNCGKAIPVQRSRHCRTPRSAWVPPAQLIGVAAAGHRRPSSGDQAASASPCSPTGGSG